MHFFGQVSGKTQTHPRQDLLSHLLLFRRHLVQLLRSPVWLVVGLQVGVLLVMVASHSAQSQSPFTWYSLTEEFGIYVITGDCANTTGSPASPAIKVMR